MAWSYDPNLSSTRDQVRFLVGDTDTNDQLVQNEEITFALLDNPNIYRAAATVARAIAARLAREVTLVGSPGGIELDAQKQSQRFTDLAKELELKAKTSGAVRMFAGGISKSDKDARASDGDRVQGAFTVDLHRSSPSDPTKETRS